MFNINCIKCVVYALSSNINHNIKLIYLNRLMSVIVTSKNRKKKRNKNIVTSVIIKELIKIISNNGSENGEMCKVITDVLIYIYSIIKDKYIVTNALIKELNGYVKNLNHLLILLQNINNKNKTNVIVERIYNLVLNNKTLLENLNNVKLIIFFILLTFNHLYNGDECVKNILTKKLFNYNVNDREFYKDHENFHNFINFVLNLKDLTLINSVITIEVLYISEDLRNYIKIDENFIENLKYLSNDVVLYVLLYNISPNHHLMIDNVNIMLQNNLTKPQLILMHKFMNYIIHNDLRLLDESFIANINNLLPRITDVKLVNLILLYTIKFKVDIIEESVIKCLNGDSITVILLMLLNKFEFDDEFFLKIINELMNSDIFDEVNWSILLLILINNNYYINTVMFNIFLQHSINNEEIKRDKRFNAFLSYIIDITRWPLESVTDYVFKNVLAPNLIN
ncbi:uncharacterized protein TA21140 [Theileria annulata]|uniref:Uncharacterized protein n=1 Tax=Theileria annulata TaxID=5874 RepID=Q4UGS8_THEAN|nr:uncharacterized protein TA21140 [Theileria annulata]CAI73711.1 hypothetical protein TA21140 [Theileria annulata]|eukprot:XP_954388.1 hypothetical protein TA21140 [Theileria annulata]